MKRKLAEAGGEVADKPTLTPEEKAYVGERLNGAEADARLILGPNPPSLVLPGTIPPDPHRWIAPSDLPAWAARYKSLAAEAYDDYPDRQVEVYYRLNRIIDQMAGYRSAAGIN